MVQSKKQNQVHKEELARQSKTIRRPEQRVGR